jgi:hypothetical protein
MYDTGTTFYLRVTEGGQLVNISTATDCQLLFRSPAGTHKTVTATIVLLSGSYRLTADTTATLLDASGVWSVQGRFSLGGWTGTTERVEFEVQEVNE